MVMIAPCVGRMAIVIIVDMAGAIEKGGSMRFSELRQARTKGNSVVIGYLVEAGASLSLRIRTCPLEWKVPPVAVCASVSGFVGVKCETSATRPVEERVFST